MLLKNSLPQRTQRTRSEGGFLGLNKFRASLTYHEMQYRFWAVLLDNLDAVTSVISVSSVANRVFKGGVKQ
jgi:hypothetical protein